MIANSITSVLLAGFCLIAGCRSPDPIGKATSNEPDSAAERRTEAQHDQDIVKAVTPSVSTANPPSSNPQRFRPLYTLKAGTASIGPTNAPNSTPVQLSFVRFGSASDRRNFGEVAFFRLTNREDRSILLYNLRVQVHSTNSFYLDPPGWETVVNDYPEGPGNTRIPPGSSEEFRVHRLFGKPWRVCIVYSKDWAGTGTTFGGHYEIISEEMRE